jgi:mannitol-1-phosphate/altronate dehydrogenase
MKPTLLPVPGVDTDDYCNKLLERFSNPYIKDKLLRLAEDGSKKMQNTMRDAVLELCDSGRTTKAIAFANAAWIRFCYGTDEVGPTFTWSRVCMTLGCTCLTNLLPLSAWAAY